MKIFTSNKQLVGERGEQEAVKCLVNRGFKIIERNYTSKWGELDIVAKMGNVLHFIEVKSITVKDMFSREKSYYRPEENMTYLKIRRLKRVLQTYLIDREVPEETEWQFDLICIHFIEEKVDKIEVLEDIVI